MAKTRKVRCIETGEVFDFCREAEIKLGLSDCAVSKVLRGSRKTAKGYHFEYVEVEPEPEQMYLTTTNEQGETIPVIDSREVARMMGVTHGYLLKCIEGGNGVVGILPTLSYHEIKSCDYYIPSSFKQSNNNAENRCYLVTKKGCELLGNKQQGEKGILFSLAYVERFNEMEKELKQSKELVKDSYMIDDPIKRAERWIEEQKEKQLLADKLEEQAPKVELADERLAMNGCISITDANKTFGLGKGKLMQWARNKGFIDKRKYIKEVNQAGRKYFKVYQTGEYRNIGITVEGMKLIKENKEEINSVKLTRNV